MAKASEWQRYQLLCSLILQAVDEANDNEDEFCDKMSLAISPDLTEVYATYKAWWLDERFVEADKNGWFLELVSADEPTAIAEYYFDLR